MKKTIFVTILVCICLISVFSGAITKTGKITSIYFYNTSTADVWVIVDGQGYFIDNTVDGYKTILSTLLLAKSTGASLEIMGNTSSSWVLGGTSFPTVYRIFRVSILD